MRRQRTAYSFHIHLSFYVCRPDDEEVRVRMESTENEYTEPRYPMGDHT